MFLKDARFEVLSKHPLKGSSFPETKLQELLGLLHAGSHCNSLPDKGISLLIQNRNVARHSTQKRAQEGRRARSPRISHASRRLPAWLLSSFSAL